MGKKEAKKIAEKILKETKKLSKQQDAEKFQISIAVNDSLLNTFVWLMIDLRKIRSVYCFRMFACKPSRFRIGHSYEGSMYHIAMETGEAYAITDATSIDRLLEGMLMLHRSGLSGKVITADD